MHLLISSVLRATYSLLIFSLLCPTTWANTGDNNKSSHEPTRTTTQQRLFGTATPAASLMIPLGIVSEETPCGASLLDTLENQAADTCEMQESAMSSPFEDIASSVTSNVGSVAVLAYRVVFEPLQSLHTAGQLIQHPLQTLECAADAINQNTLTMIAHGAREGDLGAIAEGTSNLLFVVASIELGTSAGKNLSRTLWQRLGTEGDIGIQVGSYTANIGRQLGVGVATLEPVMAFPAAAIRTTTTAAAQTIAAATNGMVFMTNGGGSGLEEPSADDWRRLREQSRRQTDNYRSESEDKTSIWLFGVIGLAVAIRSCKNARYPAPAPQGAH